MNVEYYNGRKIPVNEVLAQMDDNTPMYKSGFFDGAEVNLGLLNVRLYKAKGCDCVHCGLEGQYFRVERMGRGNSIYNEWHLNLYGVNEFGHEVLITKDHIHAKSKGGTDEIRNLQPMCKVCNTKKKDMPMDEFQRKYSNTSTKKLPSKCEKHFTKVSSRIKDRYGIEIDMTYFTELTFKSHKARIIKAVGSNNTIRAVDMHGRIIKVFYHGDSKCVISAMEDKPDQWFYEEMVPNFAKHDPERAKHIYRDVINRAKEQLKILDTPAETAQYIQSCEYPAVMFNMWKKPEDEYRISTVTWTIVQKIFKSLSGLQRKPENWDAMSLDEKIKHAEEETTGVCNCTPCLGEECDDCKHIDMGYGYKVQE